MTGPALPGRIRASLAVGPLWLGLAACLPGAGRDPGGVGVDPSVSDTGAAPESPIYRCGGEAGVRVRVTDDAARVALPEGIMALPRLVSASGAKYGDGRVAFWSEGGEARLELGDSTAISCALLPGDDVWERARQRGVEFRAVGQEPGWVLEIERERWIHLATDYGRAHAYAPVPAPAVDRARGTTTYRAVTGVHALVVALEERPCRDVMSGEAFPTTVTVHLQGRRYDGCGMRLR